MVRVSTPCGLACLGGCSRVSVDFAGDAVCSVCIASASTSSCSLPSKRWLRCPVFGNVVIDGTLTAGACLPIGNSAFVGEITFAGGELRSRFATAVRRTGALVALISVLSDFLLSLSVVKVLSSHLIYKAILTKYSRNL